MKTKIFIFLIIASLMSCNNNDDDGVICTTEFVYGLNITLKDINTNAIISQNVSVKAVDGDYEETLMNIGSNDIFSGAGERPGNYTITVTSSNYQTYTSDVINISSDVCHVIGQSIEISLTPN